MTITWYGTASILITADDESIIFDPYLKRLLKCQETPEQFNQRLNAFQGQKNVFITHGHFDHLGSITQIYKNVGCKIFLTKSPYKRLIKEGINREKLTLISANKEIILSDTFKIRTFPGKHVKLKTSDMIKQTFSLRHLSHPLRKLALSIDYCKYHENGEILFYEIIAEGKRIQIMGSANLSDNVDYPKNADLLILPHQGRSDIDEQNKKIIERLMPKRVLIDHYDDSFPPYSADVFVDDFCAETSKTVPTQKLIEGEKVEI